MLSPIRPCRWLATLLLAGGASLGHTLEKGLAESAEAFAAKSLGVPDSSVRAQSIDRRQRLGTCASEWLWRFAFESTQTVQVECPGEPKSRRFVAISVALPRDTAAAIPATTMAVVAERDLPYGHVLTDGDVRLEARRADAPGSGAFGSIDSVVGRSLTRPIMGGSTLGRADVRLGTVVKRNSLVHAWTEFSGGRAATKLVALGPGKVGEWIELENPQSGRKLRGEVQIDGSVRLGVREDTKVASRAVDY
ncbi:MAG: flagellar basal body P-ring formation chaperone FlgA [Nevskiaceae bacterium]